ncbi:MAG: ATP-binding cassette domain-containing protein [Campylobacterales bacterium]|nr:ATP-binding cassette domain-containing protein [Campylobacterales bacterium]NQY52198.1 ATP-binding cassette domain-containing protein [Campylobacteraceae bacterium]
MSSDIILKVEDLRVTFDIKSNKHFFDFGTDKLKAVDGISFELKQGETLGIVGESGCGKSTLARAIIDLVPSASGKIIFEGKDLTTISKKERWLLKKDMQMIFQDPLASLDPRMTIGDIIAEPLLSFFPELDKKQRKEKVLIIMAKVGLLPNVINRYAHEFSGGQCQRIGIARALITEPKLIICDEPVSALDVSIQAQVTNLLMDLQKEMNLSLIFISHDLSVVKHISNKILVIYLGNMVEFADKNELFDNPLHPYNKALISAVPVADPRLEKAKKIIFLEGDLPSPINPPSGCVFRTRCPNVIEKCSIDKPGITKISDKHILQCYNY